MAMHPNAATALALARANRKPRTSTPSRRSAIREKCKDCIYDDCSPGTWLQQVTACTSQDCALWAVRPVSKVAKDAAS